MSRFTVTYQKDGQDSGWRVRFDFGRDKRVEPAACPTGTVVEVEDIFLKALFASFLSLEIIMSHVIIQIIL